MTVEKVRITSQDPWDVIRTIALIHSKNSLRTIEQLVDNALDAQAHNIVVEIKKKGQHKASPSVTITDDGEGWAVVEDPADLHHGLPDLWYTVQHIGDSIKKKNEEFIRRMAAGLDVGQFGIGLLSFWGLGERMTIVTRSRLPDNRLSDSARVTWIRDKEETDLEAPCDNALETSGTVVVIDRLIKYQLPSITGKTVADYLSAACRSHLARTKARLIVNADGKKLEVKPRKFEGTLVPVQKVGELELELYIPTSNVDPSIRRVSLFKKSEVVTDDVSRIPQLNISPWNDGRVYGTVSFPRGTLSPDRTDLINDSEKGEFIDLMTKATKAVIEFIQKEEKRLKDLRTQETARLLKETWESIFRNLPEAWRRYEGKTSTRPPVEPVPKPAAGLLDNVEIAPTDARVQINGELKLRATPKDSKGTIIPRIMLYAWEIIGGGSRARFLDSIGREVTLIAGARRGVVTAHVSAVEDGHVKKSSCNVFIVEQLPPPRPPPPPPPGDVPPIPDWISDESGAWRSHFQKSLNTVEINDVHSDYKGAIIAGKAAQLRYENMCIAREVAVDRWKDVASDPHDLSERVIELILISEKALGFAPPELPGRRGRPSGKRTIGG